MIARSSGIEAIRRMALGPTLARVYGELEAQRKPRRAVPPGLVEMQVVVLRVTAGPGSGAVFTLTSDAIIGRSEVCRVRLQGDGMVSRLHARVSREQGAWRIEDGRSTNGLSVDGERVKEAWLQPGQQVTVGQTVLLVE